MENPADVRPLPELYRLEKQAETYLRSVDPGALPRQIGFAPATATPGSTKGYRYPDIYNPDTALAIEVKAGHWKALDYVKEQIAKDVALRADPQIRIDTVEWHFFPRTNGTFGPSDELRELLMANNIPYVIHLP